MRGPLLHHLDSPVAQGLKESRPIAGADSGELSSPIQSQVLTVVNRPALRGGSGLLRQLQFPVSASRLENELHQGASWPLLECPALGPVLRREGR